MYVQSMPFVPRLDSPIPNSGRGLRIEDLMHELIQVFGCRMPPSTRRMLSKDEMGSMAFQSS